MKRLYFLTTGVMSGQDTFSKAAHGSVFSTFCQVPSNPSIYDFLLKKIKTPIFFHKIHEWCVYVPGGNPALKSGNASSEILTKASRACSSVFGAPVLINQTPYVVHVLLSENSSGEKSLQKSISYQDILSFLGFPTMREL